MMKMLLQKPETRDQRPEVRGQRSENKFLCHLSSVLCLLSSVICLLPNPSYATAQSSSELIASAKQYNAKVVVYQGEIIGDVMIRGKYCWININDGQNAIGVWLEKKLVQDIYYTGSYKSQGDLVRITGIFYDSCIEHGGDLDIHATSIEILEKGKRLEEKTSSFKIKLAIYLLIVCLVLTGIYFIQLSRRRKR